MTDYIPRKDSAWEGVPFVLTGLCLCKHTYDDHHDGGMAKDLGGCPSECEFYGSNECGGQMPTDSGEWVKHCSGYCDQSDPDPSRHANWRKWNA